MTGKTDQPSNEAAQGTARLRLNLRQLEVFVATAREGSTRAAA
ncbi:MAG TPA: LysR family transcriptional regulator, partial [Variovorax sp.]|nr:LysR family transcriptional regulator [Variovorax sp.]